MSEKRIFPRRGRRLIAEFHLDGAVRTGFTHDVSQTGMFVASSHVPPHGRKVELKLSLPSGRKVAVAGKVVRARVSAMGLSQSDPSGFSLQVDGYYEEYSQYISSLERGAPGGSQDPQR